MTEPCGRVVEAAHARRAIEPDPDEIALADGLSFAWIGPQRYRDARGTAGPGRGSVCSERCSRTAMSRGEEGMRCDGH